ncbi:PspC domain-containing protein [Paenibacillus hamazuiensis]|uniref:PspC domain-containing protein n=1 Tax=Paenibacillus hamazuiensis TaxID=2936508 RepID=UPI00200C08F8|nr:PspC domain-containing protein [Paenibacillus hamazuiensis]
MSKLYRSRTDRKVTGLCGGLAEWLNFDATLLRVIVVITAFFSGGVVIPLYFLASLVIPKEPYPGGEPYGYGGPSFGFAGCHHHGHRDHRFGHRHERQYQEGHYTQAGSASYAGQSSHNPNDLDAMMKDIEKKALWKEIEELRAKVAQFEKQQNQNETINHKEEK